MAEEMRALFANGYIDAGVFYDNKGRHRAFAEMSTTCIIMMKRMKKCIRHVPLISLFPMKTALNTLADVNRTYTN